MDAILQYLQQHQNEILADLKELVLAESPSTRKDLVDQCGETIKEIFNKRLRLQAEVIPQQKTGDHLRFIYGEGEEQILILSHFDTVWEEGRLTYRIEGNRAYGPGIFDMKGGLIQAVWAVKALKNLQVPLRQKVVFLCTSDEEIGSHSSRQYIEEEALRSTVVLVPESAVANTGALKTARKGVGEFTVRIKGKASHAGNHHEDGISAVEEMAHQILYLHSLTDYEKGTTLNVGIAHGGTRTNVVAEQAELHIDVRVSRMDEAERITRLICEAKPHLAGITLEVAGEINRPPMERTEKTAHLFQIAVESGKEIGIPLSEASVGGGSDGNFTAALGIPTLDGLGAVGDGLHAEHEHVLIDQLPIRAALLAKILTKL